MAAIAAFAASDQGRIYSSVCQGFGIDPAAGFADDVAAFNLRAALLFGDNRDRAEKPEDEWDAAAAENERAWLAG
jgi:hypothetical protein